MVRDHKRMSNMCENADSGRSDVQGEVPKRWTSTKISCKQKIETHAGRRSRLKSTNEFEFLKTGGGKQEQMLLSYEAD